VVGEPLRDRIRGLERRELIGLVVVGALVVAAAAFWYVRSLPSAVRIETTPGIPAAHAGDTARPSPSPSVIVVDVAGWVGHPGVYEFVQGDRVVDALRRAGGARPGADLTALNLAALLTDGEQVVVGRAVTGGPAPAGSASGASTGTSGGTGGGLVNLNTATLDQLESLPGIGPSLGQRIIDYRELHGPFRSVDDLLNVSGIGDKRLADLRSEVTV